TLSDDDREFSLCPPDRGSTQIVRDSQVAEDAAAYQGPGPHPIVPFGDIPENWKPPRESDGRYQVDEVQLELCAYQYAVGAKGQLQTCTYREEYGTAYFRIVVQSATVDYRLYEATTGRLLTGFTLEAVGEDCASFVKLHKNADPDVTTAGDPDFAEVKRRVEPFVTADLPARS
ncbi:MAG: hypothetical protein QOF58_3470, partial [Pseudonocardiales bacterium]|nr:hypothetical protein [Pseudonocardiales bacterium]